MAIIAKAEQESNFTPIPEGVHSAICYAIIDLGMQYSEKYEKSSHKIMIMWEFPEETYEVDGETKPRVISKEYTLSLGDKSTLRKDLQAWRGKAFTDEELVGFDLVNVLGKGCQIQIIHKESNSKTYSNIAAIMGLPKGMKLSDTVNTKVYFEMDSDNAGETIASFPAWIQEKIKASESWKAKVDSDEDDLF